MVWAIVALAFAGLAAAATATAFGVRKGQLEGDRKVLRKELADEQRDHLTTQTELTDERARSSKQLEHLRDELTDLEDMLATCSDPTVIHDLLDRVLQEASGGSSDAGSS